MFYEPENGHGLPHDPFNAIIAPRPIGWISTRDAAGRDNLAPYSFFNGAAYAPPQVMFASTGSKADRDFGKDTLSNIRQTGMFCVNVVQAAALTAMNATSAAHGQAMDEFRAAGVDRAECRSIDCPRVADAPAALECRASRIVTIEGADNHVVFGTVTGIHLRDDCLVDGIFDVTRFTPAARLGYRDYTLVREVITLKRPGE